MNHHHQRHRIHHLFHDCAHHHHRTDPLLWLAFAAVSGVRNGPGF